MFDLIVHAHNTVLVRCDTAKEQMAVILDCQENGFDYEVPSSLSTGYVEIDSEIWLSI